MKPRIAIPVPTTIDIAYNQRSWPIYATAVTLAGGEPVVVDLNLSAAERTALIASCQGVVLPGSPADVDPTLYGADRFPECGRADAAREAMDFLLLEDAERYAKPVLAICYGLQSLNTWRGGSLIQDLAPVPVNHEAGGQVAIAHMVLIAKDSLLASLVNKDELVDDQGANEFRRLPVNSSHHQAIAAPGEGLRIASRCPEDGVIEALELHSDEVFHVEQSERARAPWFVLGIQWHPERSYDISATSRALFNRLIDEAGRVRVPSDSSRAV